MAYERQSFKAGQILRAEHMNRIEDWLCDASPVADSFKFSPGCVGKTIRVAAVDEKGKPTKWETIDLSEYASSDTVPVSADTDETNLVSFRNKEGIVLFTLDLADLGGNVFFGNVVVSAETIEVTEGGTGTFTVCLETAPTANQPVYLAVSDNTRLTVAPANLTFTPENYNEPQTVTVTSAQDDDEKDNSIVVTLTSRKVDAKQLLVNIVDDDKPVMVESGLYCNLDFRDRVDDNGDGGDHTIVNSVNGTAYVVNNMLFDGENDGFHAKGIFFRPPSAFANYNQYNATTFGSIQLFSTNAFLGDNVVQDNTQDIHATIEITGTLASHAGAGAVAGFIPLFAYKPFGGYGWSKRSVLYHDWDIHYYDSAGTNRGDLRTASGAMAYVKRNNELVSLVDVFDFDSEHTFTIVLGPGTIRNYVDGEPLYNDKGENVAVAEDFQYYYVQYGENKWFIGSAGGRTDEDPQYWAQVRVYGRELSADEILQNYKYDVSRRAVSDFI